MRAVFAVAALTLLAGCAAGGGGQVQTGPQGIGSSPNQLRRAPCACLELKSLPGLPSHLTGSGSDSAVANA